MNIYELEDRNVYKVIVNHEDQYSIWPEGKVNPSGWRDAGKSGPKRECLTYIQGSADRCEAVESAQEDGRSCPQPSGQMI